jgi:hypothetical protein
MTAIPAIVTIIHKSHLNQRENIQIRLQVVSVEQPWGQMSSGLLIFRVYRAMTETT